MLELYRKDDEKEYNKYMSQYKEEFQKLDRSKIEKLHFYRVTVELTLNEMENEEITKVNVTSNDKSYECDLGSIKINYSNTEHFGEDVSIESVSLDITSKKASMNREYESGQTIEIAANSEVSMAVIIKDTKLANQLDYAFLNYIVIEYEVEGKTYQQKIEVSAAIERNYLEYVCEDRDKIDLSDYYFNYLSNVD